MIRVTRFRNRSKPREGPDAEAHFKRNWSFEAFGAFLDESRGAGSFASVWARVRATARVAVEAARPAVLRGLAALSRNTRRRPLRAPRAGRPGGRGPPRVASGGEQRAVARGGHASPRARLRNAPRAEGGAHRGRDEPAGRGRGGRGDAAPTTEAEEAANELERARHGRFVSLYGDDARTV